MFRSLRRNAEFRTPSFKTTISPVSGNMEMNLLPMDGTQTFLRRNYLCYCWIPGFDRGLCSCFSSKAMSVQGDERLSAIDMSVQAQWKWVSKRTGHERPSSVEMSVQAQWRWVSKRTRHERPSSVEMSVQAQWK